MNIRQHYCMISFSSCNLTIYILTYSITKIMFICTQPQIMNNCFLVFILSVWMSADPTCPILGAFASTHLIGQAGIVTWTTESGLRPIYPNRYEVTGTIRRLQEDRHSEEDYDNYYSLLTCGWLWLPLQLLIFVISFLSRAVYLFCMLS